MKAALETLLAGQSLGSDEAAKLAGEIVLHAMDPASRPEPIAALLIALRMKTETADELLGFVQALSSRAVKLGSIGGELMDVCGTGGDRAGTFNVSTAVALVLASCGVRVAKHGNRGVSSRSGSSDVLEAMGLKSDINAEEAAESLRKHGLTFLFAPAFHPALAALAPIRKSLGTHTIFNALGPLLNPAPLTRQLIGVYHPSLLPKMVHVLQSRGIREGCVVHGSDGLDEVTLSGPTEALFLRDGRAERETLTPEMFGLERAPLEQLRGGDPAENAGILNAIFEGARGPKRDLVVMNAALALVVAGQEKTLRDGAARASRALDSGDTLRQWKRMKAS